MTQDQTAPEEPLEHEHSAYDADVPDVDQLEPDYEAEQTDEVVEVVEDEDEEGAQ